MKLRTMESVTLLTKQVRTSNKSGKNYYLYTFIYDGVIYPNLYSNVDFDLDTNAQVDIELELSVFNNRINMTIKSIIES